MTSLPSSDMKSGRTSLSRLMSTVMPAQLTTMRVRSMT